MRVRRDLGFWGSPLSQHAAYGTLQRTRSIPAQFLIQRLQPLNQIRHMFARIHPARLCTKMRAAAEGAVLVNGAFPVPPQQRAGTIGVWFQRLAPARTHPLGRIESLATRQHGCMTRQTKVAAAGAHFALPGQGTVLQLGINGLHLRAVCCLLYTSPSPRD